MKIESIPKSGRDGDVVYVNNPHWKIKRKYTEPRDPRTSDQLDKRANLVVVCDCWHRLTPAQLTAWRAAAAENEFMTETGELVRRSGYHFFRRINMRRAHLGLPGFDLPPAKPFFHPNPVAELVMTTSGDQFTLKLWVPSPPAQYTLVQGPGPKRSGIRLVQHFPFLGLLPTPIDGWSDITGLYLARYRAPKVNETVWIRTYQHIDGWIDVPKVVTARFRDAAS